MARLVAEKLGKIQGNQVVKNRKTGGLWEDMNKLTNYSAVQLGPRPLFEK